MLPGVSSQSAFGSWLFASFVSGTVRLYKKVLPHHRYIASDLRQPRRSDVGQPTDGRPQ